MKPTLITVTKDRPKTFDLLQHWVERQDYKGEYTWLVVNDSPKDTYNYRLGQKVVRRKDDGKLPSICGNWIKACNHVDTDCVIVLEDDDYYHHSYVTQTLAALEDVVLFGWSHQLYYNVRYQTSRQLLNVSYAALAATAFKTSVLERMAHIAKKGDVYIDGLLWDGFMGKTKLLPPDYEGRPLTVGIKGMGEGDCYGRTHTDATFGRPDYNRQVLHKWLGNDANIYQNLMDELSE